MAIWNADRPASVANGATLVYTQADFRSNYIEEGKGFQFPDDDRFYQIVSTDERNGRFTISPAYKGTTKVDQSFWVLPFLGVAQSAERSLRDASDAFRAAMSPDPLDMTPGRLIRLGDFGENGYPVFLSAEHDLNDVTVPGLYHWSSDSVPTNAPLDNGSHMMRVEVLNESTVQQHVSRITQAGSSLIKWWRNIFPYDEPATRSPWTRDYTSRNIIGTVTRSGNIPTGSLVQLGGGNAPYWWRAERYAWGVQDLRAELEIDVSNASGNQQWTLPTGYTFVAGGKVAGRFSYRSPTPNAALAADNVTLVAYNGNITIRLATAGTPPGSPDDTVRLMVELTGRWFE